MGHSPCGKVRGDTRAGDQPNGLLGRREVRPVEPIVCIYAYMCVCMYVSMYVCMYVCHVPTHVLVFFGKRT